MNTSKKNAFKPQPRPRRAGGRTAGRVTVAALLALGLGLGTRPAQAQLVDRLLVNINSQNYSQRQFELYMALETLLFTSSPRSSWRVSRENWNEKLEVYVNHMLVDHNARALETFTARPNEVLIAQKKLAQIKDGSWQRFVDRLGFSKSAVATERDRMIRVAKFICHRFRLSKGESQSGSTKKLRSQGSLASKQGRPAAMPSCQDGQQLPGLSKDYRWFHRVVQETPFRVYDGARTYQPLLAFPKLSKPPKTTTASDIQGQKDGN